MSAPSQPQHRIFISHSHIDNEFGTRLAQDLQGSLGDESAVWYDVLGGLHGGDTWWEKIVEELTARKVFIVVLSPEAVASPWVRDEINLAWSQKNSKVGKLIIPLLYRECSVRADLNTLQVISFLSPKTYETAFKEVLLTLGLSTARVGEPVRSAPQAVDTGAVLLQQIENSFAAQDWADVLRKADYIIKRLPERATATVYRLQGLAHLEDGDVQQGQEALETALALVTDRQLRLTLLGDYTTLLASKNEWAKVLKQAKEALRLVPNDPGWVATQEQAQSQLAKASSVKSQPPAQTRDNETQSIPQKTKEQWLEEGNSYYNAKEFQKAISAYNQAINLDNTYAQAYFKRGDSYDELKEHRKAISDYDQAIALKPNDATSYMYRGLAYKKLKEYQKALADYDRAIELNP
ncbi:MAG TPA: toll/interleukin-1 receptor domain-containing protein, partial [Ktedonobacteraceae bacterium]|nr:toll/interleukin-1 receptor domain-containing protein [Ktedonobacteraceae bacterium]